MIHTKMPKNSIESVKVPAITSNNVDDFDSFLILRSSTFILQLMD